MRPKIIADGMNSSQNTIFQGDVQSILMDFRGALARLHRDSRTQDLSSGSLPWAIKHWDAQTTQWTHAFFSTCLFMGVIGQSDGRIVWAQRGHLSPLKLSRESVAALLQPPAGEPMADKLIIRMAGLSAYSHSPLLAMTVAEIMAALAPLGFSVEWQEPDASLHPVVRDPQGRIVSDLGAYRDHEGSINNVGRVGFFGITNDQSDGDDHWVFASVATRGQDMDQIGVTIFSRRGVGRFPQG